MNKLFILLSLFLVSSLNAQVGINTDNPTRKLDINGDLRISELDNKSENTNYSKVLITDQSGNVDYVNRKDLLPTKGEYDVDKMVINNLYSMNTNTGDKTKEITCGKFKFMFDEGTTSKIKFRLLNNPTKDVKIYASMEQNFETDGYQFYQGISSNSSSPFEFTSSNFNVYKEFAEAELVLFEQNILYFQYPEDVDLYRLTVYKVEQKLRKRNATSDTSTYDFVTTCEKF